MSKPIANTAKEAVTIRINTATIRQFRGLCAMRGLKANEVIEELMNKVIQEARENKEIV